MADPKGGGGAAGAPSPTPMLRASQFEKQKNTISVVLNNMLLFSCCMGYCFCKYYGKLRSGPQAGGQGLIQGGSEGGRGPDPPTKHHMGGYPPLLAKKIKIYYIFCWHFNSNRPF